MTMDQKIVVATVVNAQGITGEVRLLPWVDNLNWLLKLKAATLYKAGKEQTLEIEKSRLHKQFVVIKFKDIDDMNQALALKEAEIKVEQAELPKLPQDNYYIFQLKGLRVISDTGEELGTVADVMLTGANDVYVVRNSEGRELLLPVIEDVVKEVNLEAGIVTVHLLDGLLDL